MRNPRKSLDSAYEGELFAIRELAREFARDRRKIADRLLFTPGTGESADPHVERLIQAFAYLTARVRLKVEDDFPELTAALLGILYPHYLAPIPSIGVAEFALDPARGASETGYLLPRHTGLATRESGGVRCRFRTAYPVVLWPVAVQSARYVTAPFPPEFGLPPAMRDHQSVLALSLRSRDGQPFSTLAAAGLDRLRFHIAGDERTVSQLYELVFNHAAQVAFRAPATGAVTAATPKAALHEVGFDRDEGLLPYPPQSFRGYRLLTEYFAFPRKFHFVDVAGLAAPQLAGCGEQLEIYVFFRGLPEPALEGLASRVGPGSFRLGCSPIVNLFPHQADPVRLTHEKTEYRVTPDVRHPDAFEVYSVDAIEGKDVDTDRVTSYAPYFACRHGAVSADRQAFWHARREPSGRPGDPGTDVYVSLVDPAFDPAGSAGEILSVRTTCTNRNLPSELRAAGVDAWGFQVEGQAPIVSPVPLVVPPTPATRPPGDQARWRLISHLALNHLSVTGAGDGAEALREMLSLYDLTDNPATRQQIAGVSSVTSRPVTARVTDELLSCFCRGTEITIDFAPQRYAGTGAFLFAAVLDRFLALYSSINSFTRLVARHRGATQPFRLFPNRIGEQPPL